MAQSPSNERNSPGLNWTESQQGQTRRGHSTRGNQFGQILVAGFTGNFLRLLAWWAFVWSEAWNAEDERVDRMCSKRTLKSCCVRETPISFCV